jgi:DNA-3-methyladenine glycosylase II
MTTGNVLEEAIAHLVKTDARLLALVDKYPCPLFSPAGLAEKVDPFKALASGIIGQQVSGAAAKSIKRKFVALFNKNTIDIRANSADEHYTSGTFPTPEEVAKCDITTLRTAGLSQRKAEYIHGLAEKFASGELSAQMLLSASDEDVLEKLTAVRGLGRWSVEMFSCFGLKRMDVFSTGDLGVQYVYVYLRHSFRHF